MQKYLLKLANNIISLKCQIQILIIFGVTEELVEHLYERNENFYERFLGSLFFPFYLIGGKNKKKTERLIETKQT